MVKMELSALHGKYESLLPAAQIVLNEPVCLKYLP